MKILVVGGTGIVGSEVVRQLKTRGASVFVLTRSPEHAEKLPRGVSGVVVAVEPLQQHGDARGPLG